MPTSRRLRRIRNVLDFAREVTALAMACVAALVLPNRSR